MTKIRRRFSLTALGTTVVALGVGIAIPMLSASGSSLNLTQYPDGATYAQLPSVETSNFGVTLGPLSNTDLALVAITPSQAASVAGSHQFSYVTPSNTPTVLLGRFTDSELGPAGPAGPTSLVANNVLAYVVRYSNVSLQSYGPGGGSSVGQYSVVVNAVTGAYIMAFSGS